MKKRSIINLFDVVIIVIALAAAVLLFVLRGNKPDEQVAEIAPTKELSYMIELTSVVDSAVGEIRVGDVVYDNDTNAKLGVVTEADVQDYMRKTVVAETGEGRYAVVPGWKTVVLSITGSVTDGEREFKADGLTNIRVGRGITVRGPGYIGAGYVISMDRGE